MVGILIVIINSCNIINIGGYQVDKQCEVGDTNNNYKDYIAELGTALKLQYQKPLIVDNKTMIWGFVMLKN